MGGNFPPRRQRRIPWGRGHKTCPPVRELDVITWFECRWHFVRWKLQYFLHSRCQRRRKENLPRQPKWSCHTWSSVPRNSRLGVRRFDEFSSTNMKAARHSRFYHLAEDILRQGNAVWISPNRKKVVYATFNDSQVQTVQWKVYGNGVDATVDPYPKEAFMRYPKVLERQLRKWVKYDDHIWCLAGWNSQPCGNTVVRWSYRLEQPSVPRSTASSDLQGNVSLLVFII